MNSLIRNYFLICALLVSATIVYANEVHDVDNQELIKHIGQGVPVIDVRTTAEWKKTGIVEGSHLIMFYDEQGKYNLDTWLADVAEVADKNDPVVLICHSGGRSKQLANYLVKVVGYENVYNVKKGIVSWMKHNNPTTPYTMPVQ